MEAGVGKWGVSGDLRRGKFAYLSGSSHFYLCSNDPSVGRERAVHSLTVSVSGRMAYDLGNGQRKGKGMASSWVVPSLQSLGCVLRKFGVWSPHF